MLKLNFFKNLKPIVAIDGTAGSGKGSLAKKLSESLKFDHLDTGLLWLQTFVKDGTFTIRKIKGTENSADLGTKEVPGPVMWRCLRELGFQPRTAPHAAALKASVGSLTVRSRVAALESMQFQRVDDVDYEAID